VALKNYRSESTTTFDTIQKCLIAHRAKQVSFEYDDTGKVVSLVFVLEINERRYPFKLPARVENVEQLFYQQKNARARSGWDQRELTQAEKD
jgi:hypothetical protein